RMAKSVLMFDEVQTIPTGLVVPTLATLSRLSSRYGSSVIFATATQPAFGHLNEDVMKYCSVGWTPSPVLPASAELFRRTAGRVRINWRIDEETSWDDLAAM